MGDLLQPDSASQQLPPRNPFAPPANPVEQGRLPGQIPGGIPEGGLTADELRRQFEALTRPTDLGRQAGQMPGAETRQPGQIPAGETIRPGQPPAAGQEMAQAGDGPFGTNPAPFRPVEQVRQAGQLPPGNWNEALAADQLRRQQAGGDRLPNLQIQAGEQPVVPVPRVDAPRVDAPRVDPPRDQPQRPEDRPIAGPRLEDQRTSQLLLSTIKEMKGLAGLTDDRIQKIEAELQRGVFGPETRRAYAICARMLESQVLGNLVLLDARGLEIPTGCPLEPPVDPRSGRHIMPEWFRAQLQAGDLKLNLAVAEDRMPSLQDIAKMRAAGIWSTRSMAVLESTIIHSNLAQVEAQIQKFNFENRMNGWLPGKNLTDHEKEQWTCAAQSWLNSYVQVRNYAHAIARLNVATKDSSEPDKLFGIPVYKWTSIPRQIFPDEALKDENFPGRVVRDEKGNITSIAIDVPPNLDRSAANIAQMEKLTKWLEKYAPQVDQLMSEVAFAAAKEGRLLGWAQVPVEGTIKPDGFNVTVKEKKPDGRGGFVEVPISQKHFRNEEDANKALAELREQYRNRNDIIVSKEPHEKIEFSENPGILFGGRNLAPGEKEFNLREFRFTAEEVTRNGEKMIAVRSTQTYEYAPPWAVYNCVSYVQRTAVSGTAQEPVYYKPDDWVVVMDGSRTVMMQAKQLATFASEAKTWHYGMKAATIAMDIGFLVMGGVEFSAIWRQAAKEATAAGVRMTIAEGVKRAALSRATWHTFLGMTGVAGHSIEEMFGKYGHEFMKYRNYAMLADITFNQTFMGNWLRSTWGATRGASAVEKVSAIEQLLVEKGKWIERVAFLYRRTGNVLLATEFLMVGDIIGKAVPDMLAHTRTQQIANDVEQARQYRGPSFTPDLPTQLKLDSLMKESERVRNLPAGTDQRNREEAALATRLTTAFLDSTSAEEKLAAALTLLHLKGRENADPPEVMGTRRRGDATDTVRFTDLQKFLLEYQQQQMRALFTQYDTHMKVANADFSLKKTADMLALPVDNQERKAHVEKLVTTFLQFKEMQDKVDRLTLALEKAKQDQKDGENKRPEEKARLARAVADVTAELNRAKADWNAADKRSGAAAAVSLIAFGINKENGQLGRTLGSDRVKVEDVTAYIEKAAKTAGTSDIKFVLSDMLFRMGRHDIWQQGSTCQDILRDNSITDAASSRNLKIAALLNDGSPRIGELLEVLRYSVEPQLATLPDAGDRARVMAHTYGRDAAAYQETLLAVVRNQREDADVRAMASRLLLACSVPTQAERQAMFQQLKEDWLRLKNESGAFARNFIQTMKADLNRNTDGGDGPQRQALLDKKFRAALALSELGGPAELGIDAAVKAKTTQALIDCFDYTKPALALQVLPLLVPKRLGELTQQQLKDVRDTFQQMLGAGVEAGATSPDAIANGHARTPLRMAIIERLPQVLAGASDQQKTEIINTLKGIISFDERFRTFFASNSPELRACAVKTLAELASTGNDALKTDTIRLLNGLVGMAEAQKKDASADVRLAALNGLEKLKAPDLQTTALKLLKEEKDPRVLEKLWALEYSERRPDFNSRRSRAAFETAQRRLQEGLDSSSLNDGKDLVDRLLNTGTIAQRQGWWQTLADKAKGNGADSVTARRGLAHMIINGTHNSNSFAARTLCEICRTEGPKASKELAVLIERCLLSQPRMGTDSRSYLLQALDHMKPGTDGSPVSREDAAILIATVLERDLRNIPRHNVPQNPIDHRTLMVDMPNYRREEHEALQREALRYLEKYGSDKIIPLLESMAEENIQRDAAGRPSKITYPNGTSREFIYESTTGAFPKQVIEQPSGEVWTRGDRNGICFDWTSNKGGKRTQRADIVLNNGEYSYEDGDGVQHRFYENGSEVQRKDQQVIKVVYPDGKSRSFTYETVTDVFTTTRIKSFTEMPANVTWTRSRDDKNTWTNGSGGSMRSYCDFVIGSFNCYGARGGDPGTFCRVTGIGDASSMQVFTSSGAELQVRNGVVTEVSAGSGRHSTHPAERIREQAKVMLSLLRDGTATIKAQADEQLRQSPELGRRTTQQKADDMARVLGDNRIDSATVCRAIFLNCLTTPIANAEDPRRQVLQQAMRDAHPQVRIAAARMLFEKSDLKADREQAVTVLTDIEKNGSRQSYRKDAADFLGEVTRAGNENLFHKDDWKLVFDARRTTPDRPHQEPAVIRTTVELVDDTDTEFQRAFERAKVELTRGEHRALSMSWHQWQRWFVDHDLKLLDPVNFAQLQHQAARKRWEGRSFEWHTSGWTFIRAEEQKARDAQIPFFWAQFDQLVDKARTKGDRDAEGVEAREALVYVIMSGGESFNPQFSRDAVKRAADGILDICKGQGAGRGDLDWAIKACLIEQPKLDPAIRLTLLKALDELVTPKGKVTKESAANIAALALEAEYRNMPNQGEPGYQASIDLQLEYLNRMRAHGNRDMVPVLDAISKFHRAAQIKTKAAELRDQLKN